MYSNNDIIARDYKQLWGKEWVKTYAIFSAALLAIGALAAALSLIIFINNINVAAENVFSITEVCMAGLLTMSGIILNNVAHWSTAE